jgi:hypothetical protein
MADRFVMERHASSDRSTLPAMNMRRPPSLVTWVLVAIAAVVLMRTEYHNRDRWHETDFNHYYANAVKLRTGGDPWRADAAADTSVFNYPPAFYLALSPLTRLTPQPAYWIWQTIQIGSLIGSIVLILREIGVGRDCELVATIVALAFLFPPVYGSLYDSQPTALLMLMLLISWRLARRGWDACAGGMLAAAALLKIYPVAVGGYFLLRRRTVTVVSAATFFALGIAAMLVLYGIDRNLDFLRATRGSMVPFWLDMDRNVSIAGNVHWAMLKLFGTPPTPSAHAALTLMLDVAAIMVAGAATIGERPVSAEIDGLRFSLWLMAAILLSPLAWGHYFVLIIPFYIFAAAATLNTSRGANSLHRGINRNLVWLGIGLVGIIVPYFWTPMRHAHAYFAALAITFVAGCSLTRMLANAERADHEKGRAAMEAVRP